MDAREATKLAKSVAADCLAYRVRMLNRVITGIYDRALLPLGMKVNQANILWLLSLTEQASSADIARVLVMDKSTVSRTVDRMQKNGWISIVGSGDGASQAITVTPQGRELLAKAHTQWEKAQIQAAELLGEDGVAAVMTLHNTVKP